MREINLMDSAPNPDRKVEKGWRTEKNKKIAKRFDKDFFDGARINGYGGYYYDGRWKKIVKKLKKVYGINKNSSVLDIGCGKGFLLYDLQDMIPGIKVAGLDISNYAINKAMDGYAKYLKKKGYHGYLENREKEARDKITPFMIEGSCDKLPYPDNSFDVVLSINTAHNLNRKGCAKAISEMLRVSKNKKLMFIQLDSWRNKVEKQRMDWWGITCETTMGREDWLKFLRKNKYKGDVFWTII